MSGDRRWVWVALGLIALAAAVIRLEPVGTGDTMWHLLHAERVLEARSFSYPDHTSFTRPGELFINHSWLAELVLSAFFRAGGWTGLAVYTALCAAASALAIGAVALRAAGARPWLAVFVTALAAGATNYRFLPRPESMFAVAVPLTILLADKFAEEKRARDQWLAAGALVLLELAWSHAHGSFILVAPLVGLALIAEWRRSGAGACIRKLPLVFVLMLGWLLGPWGIDYLHVVIAHSAGDATSYISEMKPLGWTQLYPTRFDAFLWLDLLVIVAALRSWHVRRLRLDDLARAVLGLALTCTHVRFRSIWAMLMVPWSARNEEGAREGSLISGKGTPFDRPLALLAILILPLTFHSAAEHTPGHRIGFGLDREFFPVEVSELFERNQIHGRLFNMYEDGGYFAFRNGPGVEIAIDGRTPTFFDDELYFLFRRACYSETAFQTFDERYQPTLALPFRKYPICRHLQRSPEWSAAYVDHKRTLFVRGSTLAQGLPRLSHLDPCDPEGSVAAQCRRGGEEALVVKSEIEDLLLATPEAPYPMLLAAEWELSCAEGSPDRALDRVHEALRVEPSPGAYTPYLLAARALTRRGDLEEALVWFDSAMHTGADADLHAHALRGSVLLRLDRPKAAVQDLGRAVTELGDQADPELRLEYARALSRTGRSDQARVQARRAAWTGAGEAASDLLRELGDPPP